MTDEPKNGEDGAAVPEADESAEARGLEVAWDELEEEPSEAPGFEGATPRALARALFQPKVHDQDN